MKTTVLILALLLISTSAIAEEFNVEINWTHSGRGMDKFIFQYATTSSGVWSNPLPVLISSLVPSVVGDVKYWSVVLVVEADNVNELRWWRCYAETSYGKQSNISEPSQKKIMTPDGLKVYI